MFANEDKFRKVVRKQLIKEVNQQHKDLVLKSINFLKFGENKDHRYLLDSLNELLPTLTAMKEEGLSFQHIVRDEDNIIISNFKFEMDDLEELERFIDSYTINEISFGDYADFDLPHNLDKHSMTEDLLIVQQ